MNVDVEISGIRVDENDDYFAILEADSGPDVLPVPVEAQHAQVIQLYIDNRRFKRPLTHDLFVKILSDMGGAVDSIEIYDYESVSSDDLDTDEIYYAHLRTESYADGRETITYDVHAADAIAIGMITSVGIEVTEDVIEEKSVPGSEIDFEDAL